MRRTRRYLALILGCSAALLGTAKRAEATNVGGTLSVNTTWTAAASPYVVTSDVTVAAGVTLTVEPGVTVKLNQYCRLVVYGTLTGVGTAEQPIAFTSNQATPTAGYWRALLFMPGSSASRLSYVTASYGGYNDGYSGYTTVYVDGSSPSFDHLTISNSGTSGMRVVASGASPTLTDSTIRTSAGSGLRVDSPAAATVTNVVFADNTGYAGEAWAGSNLLGLTGLTVTGNGGGTKNAVAHYGGTITGAETWRSGIEWHLLSDLQISSPGNSTGSLTIQAGTRVKMGQYMRVVSYGKLTAIGSVEQPIVFTSNQATPTAGYWRALLFMPGASTSRLSYVTASYGGYNDGYSGYTTIYVDGSSPTFDHLTISNSGTSGMRVVTAGASPTLTDSAIRTSAGSGLRVDSPASATVTNSVLADNTGYAMEAWAGSKLLDLTGLTVTGNGGGTKNGVAHYGGTIIGAETWRPGIEWHLLADLQVASPGNSTGSLTIQAGTRVKMGQYMRIVSYGTLTAIGSVEQPIVFTSNQATPTAGYWRSLLFMPGASASRLSYVTASYGGYNDGYSGYATVYVDGSSPTFDHLTISNSGTSGMRVVAAGASPMLTDSAIRTSAGSGLRVDSPASATVTSSVLADNTGYAMEAWAGSKLLDLTGLTVTGNGGGTKNGVAHYGGTITGAETWRPGIDWHLLAELQVASPGNSTGSLTIQAGTRVKMGQYMRIVSYGTLTAIGSVEQPIVFTSNQATPTAGYWRSLLFMPGASASRLSYVTASYGGYNDGYSGYATVYADGSSPTLDHLTITDSGTWGIRAGNTAGLTVTSSAFARNASGGIGNFTPNIPFAARLNYWGAASGPSGQGSGTGQGVSTGVTFEPWLTAAQTHPHFFVEATPHNRLFNPGIGALTLLDFVSALAGDWTLTYRNSSGAVVRTLSGSGANGSAAWDGRDSSGSLVSSGTYTFDLASTSPSGAAAVVRGLAILDASRQLAISGSALSQLLFSPNGDGVQDTTTYSGSFSFDDVTWQLVVRNASNSVVRTVSGQGPAFTFEWNGRSDSAQLQADGTYTFELAATIGTAAANDAKSTTLDNTPPSVAITSPGASQVLSNVYAQGVADVTVSGLATDANFSSWTLEYGLGVPAASWTALRSASTPANGVLAVWPTLDKANGAYSLRLRAVDKAGNLGATTVTTTVGNFKMTQNVLEFNPSNGQTQSYVSTVPFQLTESIVIKNVSGQVVRTLFGPATRPAGTHTDPWDGRADNGSLVADGPYFYVATASDGASSMTWDLSTQYLANWSALTHSLPIQPFDPFNNSPMTVTYNFPYPGRVSIAYSQSPVLYQGDCNLPQFCLPEQEYQESGPHTVTWASVDATGAFRGDIRGIGIVADRDQFAKNAVIAYGSKPRITNVRVTPPVFGPAVGTQKVEFDLTTNLNQSAEVAVSFLNQSSLSTLRTITVPQQSPGHVTVIWDGRADNGMLVAPGYYTVTVVVTDTLGNKSRGQILTTIQY